MIPALGSIDIDLVELAPLSADTGLVLLGKMLPRHSDGLRRNWPRAPWAQA